MRRLMWIFLGFAASCAVCTYILNWEQLIFALIFAAVAVVCIAVLRIKREGLRIPLTICVGILLGLVWYSLFFWLYLSDSFSMDELEVKATVTLTDYSYETDYGIGADGYIEWNGKPYRLRMYLNHIEQLRPGDSVEGKFLFRITSATGSRESYYHQGNGVFLLAYQKEELTINRCPSMPLWAAGLHLRHEIQKALDHCFVGESRAFAKALLLGDTADLSYETDTALKISGIRHVVAVSGLHISILFALISTVTFRKRYLSFLIGIPVMLIFAAAAGFSTSVVRACIMCSLMLLAQVTDREYDGPTALSFSVFVILLFNPMAAASVSLQLSAGSVAGILLFRERIKNVLDTWLGQGTKRSPSLRLKRWFSSSVSVTLSAMSLTTPLCAIYFGTVSLIGAVTNLLTLWIISFVFYGLMAVCCLYFLWPAGAVFAAKVISAPILYVISAAKLLAAVPMSAVYMQSIYMVLWLVFSYVLVTVFLLQKHKKPIPVLCCAVLGLCFALLGSWLEPQMDEVRVTVMDVGQGQAILLQSEGCTFLVDCGGESESRAADMVAGTLLSQGITHLDGIILTHYDTDHCQGVDNLLTRFSSQVLLAPDTLDARVFPEAAGTVCYVNDDTVLTFADAAITVFGPIYNGSDNENSLCVLFETENCAILITGDRSDFGERMLLRSAQLPDVDLLIAGHHGSRDSTSAQLLEAVDPETVIISVGKGNYYGHPHRELLLRLQTYGCEVYRTDLHGTVIFRR